LNELLGRGNATEYRRFAEADLPTRYGMMRLISYWREAPHDELVVVQHLPSAVPPDFIPLVRVHSACLTGEVLASLRCDCALQLNSALAAISQEPWGLVVYLATHEGRGIGLLNKVRAYALQDAGRDTIDANLELGLAVDARSYLGATAALLDLGVRRVRLMTNNPEKVAALEQAGIQVVERIAMSSQCNSYNQAYLDLKRKRMGHVGLMDQAPGTEPE
jgi:GTP cyclohydrolase II